MKARRILVGLVSGVALFAVVTTMMTFSPRSSLAFFSLIAIPAVAFAHIAGWRRKAVSICALAGVAILGASPIDVVLATYEEKKGICFLPLEYGIGGGIDAGYYSPGCIVPPRWTYSARYVVLLSV